MKNALNWIARRFGYEIRPLPAAVGRQLVNTNASIDYELLKPFATEAAQFSLSPQQSEAIRNLHLTGLLRERPYPEHSRVEVGGADGLEVGIWRRGSAKDGEFSRRADRSNEWFYWADKKKIGPKNCKWRVVLLGESVARGYLYDPQFNPAMALEGMLRSCLGEGKIDVVDLAKSNQTIQELRTIAGQCAALRPDVVVIFAGNNWRTQFADRDLPYVETLLRTQGAPGVKSFIDTQREHAVGQLTSQVNAILGPIGAKLIWVVPEFNLADWADPPSNAPLLVGEGNRQWRELNAHAKAAMRESDFVTAESSAKKMTELDGGTSSVPLRILAECSRAKRDHPAVRGYLEMCRDADGWDPAYSFSPRTSLSIQNPLRRAAAAHKNEIVDLVDVLGHAPPDRRLFLDYCHLTAEGIKLAMAAVASKVLAMTAGKTVSPQSLENGCPSPAAKLEGKASFLAAVHNAHFFQTQEVVDYWCARALQFWPESAQLMMRFMDFQTRRVPFMACKSAIEMFDADELGTLAYLLRQRGGTQRLDMNLGKAISRYLDPIYPGFGGEISELRMKEHSVRSRTVDLTDFYYSSTIPGPSECAWTTRSFGTNRGSDAIFASAFWETSKFVFFSEKGQSVDLKFTYRVPSSSVGTVDIAVNGHRLSQAPAGRGWQTLALSIPENCLVDGMNEIVVGWPDEQDCSDADLSRAADALLTKQSPVFYRIFGEIHALQVSAGP